MKISDAIAALEACLEQFGDVECTFTTSDEGNPAIELKDVDITNKPDVDLDKIVDEAFRRFKARFPMHDMYPFFKN